jgi:hypothetical protein
VGSGTPAGLPGTSYASGEAVMKKIKLELDRLTVESFETSEHDGEKGTVHGHGISNARCNSDISCLADTCYFLSCFDTQCYCNVETYAETCGTACDPYATVYEATCPISCYATCTC